MRSNSWLLLVFWSLFVFNNNSLASEADEEEGLSGDGFGAFESLITGEESGSEADVAPARSPLTRTESEEEEEELSIAEEDALILLQNIICDTPFYLEEDESPKAHCDTVIMGKIFSEEIKDPLLPNLNEYIVFSLLYMTEHLRDYDKESLLAQGEESFSRQYFKEDLEEKAVALIRKYKKQHFEIINNIRKKHQQGIFQKAIQQEQSYIPQAVIKITLCGHMMHRGCAKPMAKKKCPLCQVGFSLKKNSKKTSYVKPNPCIRENCPICLEEFWQANPAIKKKRQLIQSKKRGRDDDPSEFCYQSKSLKS
jgi:hypothetical protein